MYRVKELLRISVFEDNAVCGFSHDVLIYQLRYIIKFRCYHRITSQYASMITPNIVVLYDYDATIYSAL